ncbi:MAG TPA: hypothetical protein EYP85_14415 [Armatimonadetes bacterium]|nr:hypothetical protein [Armatimonadota bacterium]
MDNRFAEFQKGLEKLLAPYEGQLQYGNLRKQYSEWEDHTNVAITYETPGGSTDQINITYRHDDQRFTVIDSVTDEETTTEDVDGLLNFIEAEIKSIPQQRKRRLFENVDRWAAEGLTRLQIFRELNHILRSSIEFKGGSITPQELRVACQYTVEVLARRASAKGGK